MLNSSRSLLLFVVAVVFLPVCAAQSAPQHVRDYIYDPSGRLILTAEPSPYPPGMPPGFSAGMAGECADSGVYMNWGTATDVGPGVGGYNVYRDGSLIGSFGVSVSASMDYSIYGGASYTYSVTSFDRAGNESDPSSQNVSVPLCFCRYLFPELFPKARRGATSSAGLRLFGEAIRGPAPAIVAARLVRLPALLRHSQSASPFSPPTPLFATASLASVRMVNLLGVKFAPPMQATVSNFRAVDENAGGGR
jgi:hypothetical protein